MWNYWKSVQDGREMVIEIIFGRCGSAPLLEIHEAYTSFAHTYGSCCFQRNILTDGEDSPHDSIALQMNTFNERCPAYTISLMFKNTDNPEISTNRRFVSFSTSTAELVSTVQKYRSFKANASLIKDRVLTIVNKNKVLSNRCLDFVLYYQGSYA